MGKPAQLVGHNPDILTCLANLSADEVFTPPKLASAMLDLLPQELFQSPDTTFLDPFCKSGVFLREIARRLNEGLRDQMPDEQVRVDHILTKQLYGLATSELTSIISRRSVYCSKKADGKYSIATRFSSFEGNIRLPRTKHRWNSSDRCIDCGASKAELDRDEGREAYAYPFIHGINPEELFKVKFDVIVGNPPYQLNDGGGGGGASAVPIYNLFVEAALALEPRFAIMVTPSRWFSGGKGLDAFRERMLKDRSFAKLVDFPQLYDVFPGVKIRGGVSYWLWDRQHSGDCEVTTMISNEIIGKPVVRNLNAYDVLVRRNEAVTILDKVLKFRQDNEQEESLADQVSARRPFGLTNQRGKSSPSGLKEPVLVYGNQQTSYLERASITTNREWVDQWKVLLVKAHGTSGRDDLTILGSPVIAAPGTACTETYLVIGLCQDEVEAGHLAEYLRTRFVRFLVSLRKISQNLTRDSYRFVPRLPMNQLWSDEQLFERYSFTSEEISFIESLIHPSVQGNSSSAIALDEDDE